jgi:hypothetical protein
MRRTYISPEYKNTQVYGTYNMTEESNFFGSKMIEVEDNIYIENQNIIYYQKPNGEQTDISVESSLPSVVYSGSSDKLANHTISTDIAQSIYQMDNNTRWNIEIDLDAILGGYIFSIIKKYRTFEGMLTSMTKVDDVNTAINSYIVTNIMNRYKYKGIDFYILYKEISTNNILKYESIWNPDIAINSNTLNKLQTELEFNNSVLKVSFNQDVSALKYSFEYYFNILFEKV